MSAELPRRLLAEAVGTGIFVLFGAGSVVAAIPRRGRRAIEGRREAERQAVRAKQGTAGELAGRRLVRPAFNRGDSDYG